MAEAAANNDDVGSVLLNLAGMIRALKIMVDGGTEAWKGDQSHAGRSLAGADGPKPVARLTPFLEEAC